MYSRFEPPTDWDRPENAPICETCNQEMSHDPDVDIDEYTGRPYVTAYHFICRNRNCPPEPTEPTDQD